MGAKVFLTDQPQLQPLLAENLAINKIPGAPVVLEWGAASLGSLEKEHFDALLIADPAYAAAQVSGLVCTMQQTLIQNPGCRVYLAHKHRHKDVDDALFGSLLAMGVTFRKVATSSVDSRVAVFMS